MILLSDVREVLAQNFPDTTFYNGTIDKNNPQCVGLYISSGEVNNIAVGGLENTSYGCMPISILVHWSEDSNQCNTKANELYMFLLTLKQTAINAKKILYTKMMDPYPKDMSRDENNICEMVIRTNIYYER